MSDIKDMINQAYSKDATSFEKTFNDIMSAKMDSAIATRYDQMFDQPSAVEEEPEVEVEVEAEVEIDSELE